MFNDNSRDIENFSSSLDDLDDLDISYLHTSTREDASSNSGRVTPSSCGSLYTAEIILTPFAMQYSSVILSPDLLNNIETADKQPACVLIDSVSVEYNEQFFEPQIFTSDGLTANEQVLTKCYQDKIRQLFPVFADTNQEQTLTKFQLFEGLEDRNRALTESYLCKSFNLTLEKLKNKKKALIESCQVKSAVSNEEPRLPHKRKRTSNNTPTFFQFERDNIGCGGTNTNKKNRIPF